MMPTARELLEQADALMRRNRGRDSEIPVLTDAIATTPWQLHAPAVDIPVLTERVEDGRAILSPSEPSAGAVPNFEGDPSDWLVMDTIDPALHSVTGSAPDTLAVVPPVAVKTAQPVPEPPPVEFDLATRATHKAAGSAPTPPPAMSGAPERAASPAAPEYSPAADIESLASHTFEYPQSADDEYVALPPVEYLAPPVTALLQPPEPIAPAEIAGEDDAALLARATEERWRPALLQPPEPVAPAEIAGEDDAALRARASEERWRALAEQISMQVLQRIDLFTDTGLKEQLARHLQPIVDRASAELVGEINDQVGKLVRSYVAEAIEREIAQWRSEQH